MSMQISFNKIADVYDHQREHPQAVSLAIGAAIVEAAGPGPILELGVGTGRIAIPVALAGAEVTGVDISEGMLEVAARNWQAVADSAQGSLSLHYADVGQLPFADQQFQTVLAVHVLHLLPDWRAGLAEIVRVVRPGGRLIQGSDWRDPESCMGLLRAQLRQAAVELLAGARPPGAGGAVAQFLARSGGVTAEPRVVAEWTRQISPAAVIAMMESRADPESWALPEQIHGAVVARVRQWATERWPDLEAEQTVLHRFTLTVTEFGRETDHVHA